MAASQPATRPAACGLQPAARPSCSTPSANASSTRTRPPGPRCAENQTALRPHMDSAWTTVKWTLHPTVHILTDYTVLNYTHFVTEKTTRECQIPLAARGIRPHVIGRLYSEARGRCVPDSHTAESEIAALRLLRLTAPPLPTYPIRPCTS